MNAPVPGTAALQPARCAAALGAGALAVLSFDPVGLWLAGPLSVAIFYCLLQGRTAREAAWTGWSYGLGWFGTGASWIYVSISVYGNANAVLAGFITVAFVAILALYFALLAWAWRRAGARRLPLAGFAALWVLTEALRGWLFTGFPWLQLGAAHVTTVFSGFAPIAGVLGTSFVLALLGAALGESALQVRQRPASAAVLRSQPAALILLLCAAAWFTQPIQWTRAREGAALSVGLVQGNIPQSTKFDSDNLPQIIDTYDILSAPLWQHDVLLWPETALPVFRQNAGHILDYFTAQANDYGTALVTGIFDANPATGAAHNSVTVLGNGSGTWHKQKLVPFGEYVPLRNVLDNVLQLFALPMSSLSPGPAQQALLQVAGVPAAAFICYEVAYPDFVRRHAAGAAFLLTISNDTWFGSSWGPPQHLQLAALRARETGRYMLRATNDGISAIIDERGQVLERSEQFKADLVQGELRLFEGSTPFTRWGSWPLLLSAVLLLLQNLWPLQRARASDETAA